jgi:hypothetical protein
MDVKLTRAYLRRVAARRVECHLVSGERVLLPGGVWAQRRKVIDDYKVVADTAPSGPPRSGYGQTRRHSTVCASRVLLVRSNHRTLTKLDDFSPRIHAIQLPA